jgi:uncharacterized OsmC-like protein
VPLSLRVSTHRRWSGIADVDKVKKLVELTERYCVVLRTLAESPSVDVRIDLLVLIARPCLAFL